MAKWKWTERDLVRMNAGAHFFVFHSKDGMVISELVQVAPWKLNKWTETEAWEKALRLWSYGGDVRCRGKEFNRQVGLGIMRLSLKKAGYLWKKLFGEHNAYLKEFLGDDYPAVEKSVVFPDRRDSPPNYEVD